MPTTPTKRAREILLPWERRRAWLRERVERLRLGSLLVLLCVAALVVALVTGAAHAERTAATRAAVDRVRTAMASFRREIGRCPSSTDELVRGVRPNRHYLDEVPSDGWGHPLWIACPSALDPNDADVVSAGPRPGFFDGDEIM